MIRLSLDTEVWRRRRDVCQCKREASPRVTSSNKSSGRAIRYACRPAALQGAEPQHPSSGRPQPGYHVALSALTNTFKPLRKTFEDIPKQSLFARTAGTSRASGWENVPSVASGIRWSKSATARRKKEARAVVFRLAKSRPLLTPKSNRRTKCASLPA